MDISIFKNMSDNDFFSNKLTHIYFNNEVNDDSVDKLIEDINNANKEIKTESGAIKQPKPILIHISSNGGNVTDGMRLFSIFTMSKTPIATIVDNYSCSAATFLSVISPYRLITNYGYCIIHGYSVSGITQRKKQTQLHNMIEIYDTYFNKIIEMYKERTKFKHDELIELLQHDLLLDAKFCLKKGIVDRIIKIEKHKKTAEIKKNIYEVINSPNNNIKITCNNTISHIDKILFEDNLSPVIIHPRQDNCIDTSINTDDTYERKNSLTIFQTLNLIPRILNIKQPTYAIIDGPISIDDLLPMLYCDQIFMFDYVPIICNILYFHNKSSLLIDDNIKNTQLIFNIISQILKEKTKMTDEMIENIKSKFRMINSKEALKLGLCNTIIPRNNY
uniref:ATP-dependent Clp protease proteolytic subunit n=1 Tax=viral metagenome TaxID=1070528 RepID=A0A6C0LFB2_9ZZZZ